MDYKLSEKEEKQNALKSLKEIWTYLKPSSKGLILALFCVLINSIITVIGPFWIGDITDKYIPAADKNGLVQASLIVFGFYVVAFIANFIQIIVMGKVGQEVMFRIRQSIFSKLQALPLSFFNQNKSGDIISRVNNDTNKLDQAFSETLLRFVGNIFVMLGIGGIVLAKNLELGFVIVGIAVGLLVGTILLNPIIKRLNKNSLDKLGELSAEIQEDVSNYKVFIAFGRRDFFRNKFSKVNWQNRNASIKASIANTILTPIYEYASKIGLILIIVLGISMLKEGNITFGVLLSFILYAERLFQPLQIMASLFASIQTSLAAWVRISDLLNLEINKTVPIDEVIKEPKNNVVVAFDNVSFGYDEEKMVLQDLTFNLEKGKTYAFVGPTGGGKSTTASLITKLHEATKGEVRLYEKDIRTYPTEFISNNIGFILQDAFLFTGSIGENIAYGNSKYTEYSNKELEKVIIAKGLGDILKRFSKGLKTKVTPNSGSISLGQRQLIAFMRAVLREPKVLILDEATANIDTVTEMLLEKIVDTLPSDIVKIIIAHRLNTIKKADEIFFIAGGKMQKATDFDNALSLIEATSRGS